METIRTSVRTAYGVDIQSNPGIDSFAISNGVSGPMVDSPPEAAHGIRLIAEELCKYPPRLVRSIPHLSMQVRQTVSSRDRPIPRSSREIHRKDGFSVCTATESKAWIALTQESVDREKGSKRPIFSSAPLKDQEIRDTVHHELAHILAFHQEAALRGSERMWSRLKIMDGSAKEKTDEYRAVMVAGFIVSEDLDLKEQNAASADFLRRVSSGIMGEQYFNDLRAGRVNATYWIGR